MQKNNVPRPAEKKNAPREEMKALLEEELADVSGGLQTQPIIKKMSPEGELIHTFPAEKQ